MDPPDPRHLFVAAQALAKRHPRPDAMRKRLVEAAVDLPPEKTSAQLAWARILGRLARADHPGLDGLLQEAGPAVEPGAERAPLSWLQISGLRAGGPGGEARRALLEDVCARAAEHGPPDAVFVVGDIADGARGTDYDEARAWLEALGDAVGVGSARIFVVPGPRDAAAPSTKEDAEILARHRSRPLYVDEVLREPDETHSNREAVRARRRADRAALWGRLAEFGAFSHGWGHPALTEERPFWTAAIGDVRVFGLDSALLATGADGAETLALGMSQLEGLARLPTDVPLVVLCHHGPDKLADGTLLSGLLSQRPHVLLHTGEVPFFGCATQRLLGELSVRSSPEGDAPGVVWGRLERTGLAVWHRRWDPSARTWVARGRPERQGRPREELPAPLDRWLPGAPTPPPAPVPALATREGADFDPSRPYVEVPELPEGRMVGREGELARIRDALVGGTVGALGRTVALVGMGGLGKTRLAFEYAREYAPLYPGGVYVLHAETDVAGQLVALGERARWVSPRSDRANAMMIVSRRIRQVRDGLIVFDNLDDLGRIKPYLPPAQLGAHILVTSRVEQPGFPSLAPGLLDPGAARRLLEAESGRPAEDPAEDAAISWVVERFEGLALALELAAAWMRRHPDVGWTEYARRLEAQGVGARELRDPQFEYESATAHRNDLRSALRVSEGVFGDAPLLRRVLDLLAWSGPGPMTRGLLAAALEVEEDALAVAVDVGEGLRLLRAEREGALAGVAIHRLVAEVRRGDVPLKAGDGVAIAGWLEARREGFENVASFEANAAHMAVWEERATEAGDAIGGASLAWLRAVAPAARGAWKEAKEHLRRALGVIEAAGEVESLLGARVRRELAGVVWQFGRFLEAGDLRRAAFDTFCSVELESATERAAAEADVARTLKDSGNYAEALFHFRSAIEVLERTQEQACLAMTLVGKANALVATGAYVDALDDCDRAMVLYRECSETEKAHIHQQRAECLLFLGRPEEALHEARASAEYLRQTVGSSHPDLGRALINVGRALLDLREATFARELFTEARRLLECASPSHPSLPLVSLSLSRCAAALGDRVAAIALCEHSLAQIEAQHGRGGREFAVTAMDLALLRPTTAESSEELEVARLALIEAVGPRHPDVAGVQLILGKRRLSMGDRRGIKNIRDAAQLREQTLGHDHRSTWVAFEELGAALCNRRNFTEAVDPLTRACDGLSRLLGSDHLEAIVARSNLGIAVFHSGRRDQGLQRAAEALTLSLRKDGPAHPDTVEPRLALAGLLAAARRPSDALTVLDQGLSALPPGSEGHAKLKALRDQIQPRFASLRSADPRTPGPVAHPSEHPAGNTPAPRAVGVPDVRP